MSTNATASPSILTLTAATLLMLTINTAAYVSSRVFLPKKARWQDRYTFMWVAFDTMIHFIFEGSFLYLSTFGRQVNTSSGFFAELWREYAAADSRLGVSDPTIVALEILTVLGVGPIGCYILKQLANDDPARHYWIIILCTAELYGGWMTFCPEWLTGSLNLNTSDPVFLWVHLVLMNVIWIVVPILLMVNSYRHIASSLRTVQAASKSKKA